MQNVDRLPKHDGVHRAVGVPVVVLDDFQDTGAAKTPERLGARVLVAKLSEVQGEANRVLLVRGAAAEIVPACTHPNNSPHSDQYVAQRYGVKPARSVRDVRRNPTLTVRPTRRHGSAAGTRGRRPDSGYNPGTPKQLGPWRGEPIPARGDVPVQDQQTGGRAV